MKRLVLAVVMAAFAVSVQAGGKDDSCAASSGSCCSAKNASVEAKAECPMTKQAKNTQAKAKKDGQKQALAKQPLKSPKATG